jgi:pimeloyl-ACP methyl ester carboxylesterase
MIRLVQRRVTYLRLTIGLALIAALAITLTTSQSQAKTAASAKPTVVLVHGAWANNAIWSGVIERLQSQGYTVDAPPNPLQSLKGDAATIADLLKTSKPGSALGTDPTKVFDFVPFPGAKQGDAELYVKPAVFEHAFANGLPAKEGAVLAATQGPAVYSALTAPSGTPAWKTIPSWYVLGTIDKAIPPNIQLFMAQRMHAHITRVKAGHLSMVADPSVIANVITTAAKATR